VVGSGLHLDVHGRRSRGPGGVRYVRYRVDVSEELPGMHGSSSAWREAITESRAGAASIAVKDAIEFDPAVENVDVQHWLVLLLISWTTTSLSMWKSLDLLAGVGIGKRGPSALKRIFPLPDDSVFSRMLVTPSCASRNAE
jgi:hypothetical protein